MQSYLFAIYLFSHLRAVLKYVLLVIQSLLKPFSIPFNMDSIWPNEAFAACHALLL